MTTKADQVRRLMEGFEERQAERAAKREKLQARSRRYYREERANELPKYAPLREGLLWKGDLRKGA